MAVVLREEQASLRALKSGLHEQIGVVTKHKNDFLDRLRRFRGRTRELRYRIRELGPSGRTWFEHHEARSAQDRARQARPGTSARRCSK